jgi:hypothetical protein
VKLDDVLAKVRKNCLSNEPVPKTLEVLWTAQLAKKSPIADRFGEITLIDVIDDQLFRAYTTKTKGVAAYVAAGYRRMFDEIAFVGRDDDGALLGYWRYKKGIKIAQAPIVVVDTEGQLEVTARTLEDHFVAVAGDEAAEVTRWFARHHILPRKSAGAVERSIATLPDPNERCQKWQDEALAADPKAKKQLEAEQDRQRAETLALFAKSKKMEKLAERLVKEGWKLYRAGKIRESLKCFEEAIAHDEMSAPAFCGAANALMELGQYKKAEQRIETALGVDCEGYVDYYGVRANIRFYLKNYEGAIADNTYFLENRAEEGADDDAMYLANRAEARLCSGDIKGAIEDCNASLKLDPGGGFATELLKKAMSAQKKKR